MIVAKKSVPRFFGPNDDDDDDDHGRSLIGSGHRTGIGSLIWPSAPTPPSAQTVTSDKLIAPLRRHHFRHAFSLDQICQPLRLWDKSFSVFCHRLRLNCSDSANATKAVHRGRLENYRSNRTNYRTELRTSVYQSNFAPIGANLRQRAFRKICNCRCFDAGFVFSENNSFFFVFVRFFIIFSRFSRS